MTKGHSVLIVEDERIIAKDLQQTLAGMGYDAFAIAASADEAISRASERCPDLVLMDIRIRGPRDGIETASLLRARFGVPVIYLTAHADEATIQRANHTEPYGYLMKPARSAELRSAIEVSIYKHGKEQQLRERERWYATTLRSIADAVVVVDLTGTVIFMNRAAEALAGLSAADCIGRPMRDILRLLDPELPMSMLEHLLEPQAGVPPPEPPVMHTSAGDRILSDSASAVIDDGQMLGAVMVFRDVTEDQRVQTQRALAARVASRETLVAGVTQQLSYPVAAVLACAARAREALGRRHGPGDGRPEDVAEALAALSELEAAASQVARILEEFQGSARAAGDAT